MNRISKRAVEATEKNWKAIGRLMTLFNRHQKTIGRMLEDRDPQLSSPAALQIIKEETGLADSDLLDASNSDTEEEESEAKPQIAA